MRLIPLPAFGRRRFASLSAEEILALAIASEEEDARIYRLYARCLRETFPPPRASSRPWPRRRTSTAAG